MANPVPRTRGPYAKTARVRAGIIEAATTVFSEFGFRGATMKDVAERAGISQRGLVHHFETKDDLLLQVLEFRDQQTAELLTAEGSRGELAGLLSVVHDNARYPRLIELQSLISAEATAEEHPAHQHYAERFSNYRTYIAQIFDAIRASGDLVSPLPSTSLASMFIGLVDGLQLQWLYDSSIDVESAAIAYLETICPAVVHRQLVSIEQPVEPAPTA
ncbi:TetR/AcrR family transcriptional regulator [Leifsonia poae]|uniref:TetR/AcrR family transcriptional regulator n=1 Tax=Leifsonia poae TaxID=110933 RepID=UPI001CC086BF|nr:TetR/AcrR family transcriptional regulator [Leifsonia poae]